MGVLQKLVHLLSRLDPGNARWKARQVAKVRETMRSAERIDDADVRDRTLADLEAQIAAIEEAFERNELDYGRKLYLIENCIYGVDIQPIAVQIAKLRCFIALVVDQRIDDAQENRGIRPLPNLETKFVAANTLVGIPRPTQMSLRDPEIDRVEDRLRDVRARHFSARTPKTKTKYREQDKELRIELADLLRRDGFSGDTATMLAAWDPYDQNASAPFFDREWMFGLQEGFDIVIANPPYVRIQELTQSQPQIANYLKKSYVSASKGNYDVYVVFVELSLKLLKGGGNLSFILPHKFFNAQYGEGLRGLIVAGKHLRKIIHFGDAQVFNTATTYTCLLFLSKNRQPSVRFVQVNDVMHWISSGQAPEVMIPNTLITASDWNFVVGETADIFNKLKNQPITMKDICSHIAQGIRTSANDIYVLDVLGENDGFVRVFSKSIQEELEVEPDLMARFLLGREIKAYTVQHSGKILILPYEATGKGVQFVEESAMKRQFPQLYRYLHQNKSALEEREHGRMRTKNWYAYIYPKNIDVMRSRKILVPDIADHASFALDERGEFAFTSGYGIIIKPTIKESIYYILGLLNSRPLDFYIRRVSTPLRGGFFRYFTQFIEQLPIRRIDFTSALDKELHDRVVYLVKQILRMREQSSDADITPLQDEIDDIAGQLYDLSTSDLAALRRKAV